MKTVRGKQFMAAAEKVGAEVCPVGDLGEVVVYLKERIEGSLLVAPSPSLERLDLCAQLTGAGVNVVVDDLRDKGASAVAGLTGANFGIAETGTIVLESTSEAVRITSTLPEKHFVVLDPVKIFDDDEQVSELLERFHEELPRTYLAYLTGPSRTADIERVLTIGVHGPKELHILLLEGVSDDPMER